ncbi:hypothetical protein B0I35DRAFT_71204 [Stachybotrys elegans]|uniref:Transmembrane protein n=1 Tax=Stachybotrys elegans TaxID=80388 RepID=A0A8K0SGV0_9HYPO|nr:hypothetical protein B0I35DRAFT_71204 [Stachybotrys elegans]
MKTARGESGISLASGVLTCTIQLRAVGRFFFPVTCHHPFSVVVRFPWSSHRCLVSSRWLLSSFAFYCFLSRFSLSDAVSIVPSVSIIVFLFLFLPVTIFFYTSTRGEFITLKQVFYCLAIFFYFFERGMCGDVVETQN